MKKLILIFAVLFSLSVCGQVPGIGGMVPIVNNVGQTSCVGFGPSYFYSLDFTNSGVIVESISANDGTDSGITKGSEGYCDYAYYFSGSISEHGHLNNWGFNGALSIWVKFPTFPSTDGYILGYNHTYSSSQNCGIFLKMQSNGKIIAGWHKGSYLSLGQNAYVFSTNTWSRIIINWEMQPDNSIVGQVFVNDTINASYFTPDNLHIGTDLEQIILGVRQYHSSTYDYPINGYIDDLRIWNAPLTNSEIQCLFENPCQF